jgi:CubicO group peptidase (beta-lactamase class C family)
VTTAADYARFLSLVCKGEGLSRSLYDDMLRPQSTVPPGESPFPTSYGLGWMIADLGGATLVGHGGDNDQYRTFGGFIRESRDGVVVLTNGANGKALIDVLVQPPPAPRADLSAPEAVFEEFWSIYNDGYALFGVKHVDWDGVYRVYRSRVSASTTNDELWSLLGEVIGLLNDVHILLRDPTSTISIARGICGWGIDSRVGVVALTSDTMLTNPLR